MLTLPISLATPLQVQKEKSICIHVKGKKKRAEKEAEAVTKLTVPQTSPLPKTGGGGKKLVFSDLFVHFGFHRLTYSHPVITF